jgi:hypothetical protein
VTERQKWEAGWVKEMERSIASSSASLGAV